MMWCNYRAPMDGNVIKMANQWDIRAQMANSNDHTKQPVNRRLSSLIYIAVGLISDTALTIKAHIVVSHWRSTQFLRSIPHLTIAVSVSV